MTISRSKLTLSSVTILTLSWCSNAYAANSGEPVVRSTAAITTGLPAIVVAADDRETNLSKTATSLIVTGVERIQDSRKQR